MSGIVLAQLNWLLSPLQSLLDDPAVTDIHINGPDPCGRTTTAFVKRAGERTEARLPLSLDRLIAIADNAAALARQDVAEDAPFCSARLPGGERLQIVAPPAVPEGRFAMAIRRPSARTHSLDELEAYGTFAHVRTSAEVRTSSNAVEREMLALQAGRRWREMIEYGIANGLNGIWCGMVGSGKTHILRSFVNAIPLWKRIATVEDMQELIDLPHRNVVHLLYPKGKQGISNHTAEDCTEAALRLDMEVLINQELRDAHAWAFLRALGSGHQGLSTCHAPSAEQALPTIGRMIRGHEAGRSLSNEDLLATLNELVHFVVYMETVDGHRRATEIHYDPAARRGLPKSVAAALTAGLE